MNTGLESHERPNVLIFCVDQMRADHFGPGGNEAISTPNLDRIAAAGTSFRRAYCNNAVCMPARASMFTGLLPRDHGLRINGQSLRRDLPTLPGILAEAGYRTHAAGKLHLTPWIPREETPDPQRYPEGMKSWNRGAIEQFPVPYYGLQSVDFVGGHTAYAYGPYIRWLEAQGGERRELKKIAALDPPCSAPECYRMALPQELHYNRFIADSTIRRIESGASGDAPWFCWCSFPDPHHPVAAPRPYCEMYDPADVPAPAVREGELDDLPAAYRRVAEGDLKLYREDYWLRDERAVRELIAMTWGMVSHIDAEIGRVLDAVEASGQAGNTVVAFVGDHGDMMGDHGLLWKSFFTFAGCTRLPWLIAAPGRPGGRICEALTCQIDLLPTVLELCGVEYPDLGCPETPFPWGESRPLDELPGRSVAGLLDGSAEAVREEVVIENDDPCSGLRPRMLVTDTHRLTIYPHTGEGELFDLRADPHELYNLYDRPEAATMRAELTDRLLRAYSAETPFWPLPGWNA